MASINEDKELLRYAGDFRLELCNIISYRTDPDNATESLRINILPQLMNLSIVEDISMECITGEIDLADAQDIRTVLPLTGLERLELKLYTPGSAKEDRVDTSEETSDPFYIYKIEKIRPSGGTGRQMVYRLHFTSREAYRNSITKVSRAFEGPIENAVAEILKDEKYLDSRKKCYIEESKSNSKFVIPNIRPFKAIEFLATQTISQVYENANYLFFETLRGYHFRSIESLLAIRGHTARPVVEKYHLQPANVRTQGNVDVEQAMRSVKHYSFEDPVNTLEDLSEGLFASRIVDTDLFYKTIETHDFDYHSTFGNFFHTEHTDGARSGIKFIQPHSVFDNTKKTLSEQPLQKLMNTTATSKVHNDYDPVPNRDLISNSISQRQQLMNNNLILNVPGNTKVHAGDLISFSLPSAKPINPGESQELNPYYSGRYLVLQIKHNINRIDNKHEMVIRCSKDAVRNMLPVNTETDLVKLKDKNNSQIISVFEDDERYLQTLTSDIDKTKTEVLT